MRVIDHHHRVVLVGQLANRRKIRNGAVHGENPVGGNQTKSGGLCFLKFDLQVFDRIVLVAKTLRLAEPYSVDDARVVELVGDDRILGPENRLEKPTVGIPTGVVEDRIFESEEIAELFFKLLVDGLRTADETYRSHPVSPSG